MTSLFFRFLLVFFIFISISEVKAQFSEIGFGIGGMTYTGDMIRHYDITQNRPAGNVFFRTNFNKYLSLRSGLTIGNIRASDEIATNITQASMRQSSFNIWLAEASATLEYHFFDFRDEKALIHWSPYFFLGAGVFTFTHNFNPDPVHGFSRVQPVIPIGIGIKYIVDPRVILGFEFGARKTFFDYLDGVSKPAENMTHANRWQFGQQYHNDWYYYIGFSLNYAFYNIPCPFNYK
jgi:hypothetical protein